MVSRKVESEKRVEYGFREEIVYSRVKFNYLTPSLTSWINLPNRKTELHLLCHIAEYLYALPTL